MSEPTLMDARCAAAGRGARSVLLLAGIWGCADACPRRSPGGGLATTRAADGRHHVASSDGDGLCPLPLSLPLGPAVGGPAGLPGGGARRVLAHWPAATDPAETGWSDVAEGRHPVVVFGHASVAESCAVYDDYRRLHRDWAAAGWVVLSVAAGGSLCGPVSAENMDDRARLLTGAWAALDELDAGAGPLGALLGDHLDPERVVLAGHSRGGGAALLAAGRGAADGRPPAGVVAFQPVDTMAWGLPLPAVTVPTLLVLAEKDSDVSAAHTASLDDAFAGPWGMVEVPGGIHAWTADALAPRPQAEPETTAAAQRRLADGVARAVLAELHGGETPAFWELGPAVAALSAAPVRMQWGGRPGALVVDDFDDDDPGAGPGGAHSAEGLTENTEGVPHPADDPDRHGRARWRRLAGDGGRLGLALPASLPPGTPVLVELQAILDPGSSLSAELGGAPVPLAVPLPGDASLRDQGRALTLQAALEAGGADALGLWIDGGAWIDRVVLVGGAD